MAGLNGIKPFECKNCGSCCGALPLMDWQLAKIIEALRKLPPKQLNRIKRQKRPGLTCPLRDMEKKRCAVYESRPLLCQRYGHVEGLQCPNNSTNFLLPGLPEFMNDQKPGEQIAGVLGAMIGWPQLERLMKGR